MNAPKLCRHCRTKMVNRPRGLCWVCYYNPAISARYPSTSKHARRGVGLGFRTNPPLPAAATTFGAGHYAKVEVMALRAARGEALHHPDDPADDDALEWSQRLFLLALHRGIFASITRDAQRRHIIHEASKAADPHRCRRAA